MIEEALVRLKRYCEVERYEGWDPYDGLNSQLFQATALRKSDIARLLLIQLCKRSPLNLRALLRVPKQLNAKGIGLFLNGYCNLYGLAQAGVDAYGSTDELHSRIAFLADRLLEMRSPGFSGSCWGYNFDWQARRLFYFPAGTPTVVATCFCASALFRAYEVTGDERHLVAALSAADFVLRDLRRTKFRGGVFISYSPLPGNETVYNASLLGGKLLSLCYHHGARDECKEVASQVVRAACSGQAEDGSWVYGLLPVQGWIDSFHTGYNLDALAHYIRFCGDAGPMRNLERGLDFYLSSFFLEDGTPKYYHNSLFPIDIHCPGQLWVTLSALKRFGDHRELCRKVADWTIAYMQDVRGYFYYQIGRVLSSKISYMRWSNAFMFNALSYYVLETHGERDS